MGGVAYIQQILVNNKRVLMNAKGNPRLKTESIDVMKQIL